MLTTKSVSPQKAAEYFLQGYYQEGKSRWFGKGAEKLGLVGAIDNEEVFKNIARGLSLDGTQQLSARNLKSDERRAALDCTFEAPKSVSLTALPGGDERLVEAHVKAVQEVLALMEQRCAHTRVTVDKTRQLVNTGNLVVGQFDHISSRELDPHLHTHCLVMNLVQTPDSKWYSHVNDGIVQNKKYWGMVYQQFLAALVQKLGYEIEWKGHGQFEIKGYLEEELKEFSKRREQILAVVGPNSTWAEREEAWLATRRRKEKVKPDELMTKWLSEAELLGIKFVQPKQPHVQLEQAPKVGQPISRRLLDDAIRHCSEREVAFSEEDLEKFILEAGITVDPRQIEPLFASHPELIRLEQPKGVCYTTQSALWRDRATVMLMQQRQATVQAIAHPEVIEAHLEQTQLNDGQRQAVLLAATTTDQFIAWQGVAGSGKTWSLLELKAIAEAQGYIVKGFGITTDAEKELWKKAGVETTTVARLLCSKQPAQSQPNQVWVVDESGMLSASDCYHLLQKAQGEGARVILVGDTRQFSAVSAGNPFRLLQKEGIKTAHLEESQRQRHNPELKAAIDLIAQGSIEKGFTRLEESGRIVKCDADSQVEAIVTEYMKVPQQKRADTLVLVGTHKQRLEITQAIRNALKAEGSLSQQEVKLTSLTSIEAKNDMSKVKLEYTHNFDDGDVVVPTRNYKRRQLEKGVAYEVVGKTRDELYLKSPDGKVLTVDPRFDKSVYQKQEMAIAVGDRLRWTRVNRKLERFNGAELVVEAIEGNQASVRYLDSDRREIIDLSQPQHLDYTVVRTNYSAQGKDADTVLIAADFTVSRESFYVAVSRTKQELKLFTQDPEEMLELAKQSRANSTALDEWRKHMERQMKVEAQAKSIATTVYQPDQKHCAETFTPSVGHVNKQSSLLEPLPELAAPSTVTPPIKRNDRKPKQVVPVPLQPPKKQPVKRLPEEQTDMAAIIKAAYRQLPDPPDWLATGKRIQCTGQGWGEVSAILGARLVVKLDSGETAHILEWPDAIKSKRVVPEIEAFWTPGSLGEAPSNIELSHWKELVSGSGIHPELARCNVQSVEGKAVLERLLSTRLTQIGGSGQYVTQPAAKLMRVYEQVAEGGWWAKAGIDARSLPHLKPGEKPSLKLWGSFKADNPRVDVEKSQRKGKTEVIKYEHPLGEERQLFLFEVPDTLTERIYNKHGIQPTEVEKQSGFWYCAWKYNLPITVTEGAKKTLSSLSQGEITIGLSGVNGGYVSRDQDKNRLEQRVLHPELKVFATPGREFRFAFDQDTKLSTVFNVRRELVRTGELLELEGCTVRVVQWQGDKGLDDLIVNQSPRAYAQAQANAIPLAGEAGKHYRSEYMRLAQQARNSQPAKTCEAASLNPVKTGNPYTPQLIDNREDNAEEGFRFLLGSDSTVDVEIYKLALAKGDKRDGPRLIAQSDQARSFQANLLPQAASDRTQAYIQHIEQQISQPHARNDDINPRQIRAVDNADSRESSGSRHSPSPSETRGLGHQHYQFAIEPGRLSAAISGRVEQREAERIAGSIEALTGCLEQFQLSTRGTEAQRRAVSQLHTGIKQLLQQQSRGQLLSAIRTRAELTVIASAPIAQAIEKLTQELNRQQTDDTTKSMEQLNAAISDYCQLCQANALRENSLNAVPETLSVTDGRSRVRVKTDRPQLEQYNNQVGVVVGRIRIAGTEQVMVQIGKYTPGFDNSELEPLTSRPEFSPPGSSLTEVEPPTHNPDITQPIENPNDRPDSQQYQPVDGSNIGERIAQSLEADSRATRSYRGHNDRPATRNAGSIELRPGTREERNPGTPGEQQPEPVRRLDSIGRSTGTPGDRAQPAVSNFDYPGANPDRISPTKEPASRQSGTYVERPPADYRPFARLLNELIERNHELERRNSELKEPTTRMGRAMAPRADSAVKKLEQQYQPADHRLGQHVDTLAGRNTVRRGRTESTLGQTRPGVRTVVRSYEQVSNGIGSARQNLAALADQLRELPLEDVAARLGLEPDKHDKHKWRGEGQIVSITGQKFYDHLALKGGYGAIDLVMHGKQRSFREALDWLSDGASSLPPFTQRSPQPPIPTERLPFQAPALDESKWLEVRHYLVDKRGLPAQMVDDLHASGTLYAAGVDKEVLKKLLNNGYTHPERITNAVFLRCTDTGKITGASLRSVTQDSHFKGLAPGSRKDQGWFTLNQGQGQLERIVLTESPIDAMSAAAITKSLSGTTMFIATDGTGAAPIDFLQQHGAAGVQIMVAQDADRAGEEMAWKIAQTIPGVVRAAPTHGKDWNEQLLGKDERSLDPCEWKRVASSLGKAEAYQKRIANVVESGQPLPEQAMKAMQQDFNTYQQASSELWQWYHSAKALGKSETYLKRITEVAIAFHHPKQPTPLPENAVATMQRDLLEHSQQLTQKLWQQYSQNADPSRPVTTAGVVAYAAMNDGYSPDTINKILRHDPELTNIRQRAGEEAVQNHLKLAMRNAEYRVRKQEQPHQVNQQRLPQKQQPGLQQ